MFDDRVSETYRQGVVLTDDLRLSIVLRDIFAALFWANES